MKFLLEVFFIKTHKTTWPLGRGGNFFPLLSGDLGCSVTTKWTGIAFRSVRVAQFLVVLHNFARIWGSPNSPEIGVQFMCFMISSKLQYQIVRALLRFADANFHCFQCSLVSQVALIKKILMFNFGKMKKKNYLFEGTLIVSNNFS